MTQVKCVAARAVDLPSGRMLPPGKTASGVDLDDPEVQTRVESGELLVIDEPKPKTKEKKA